MQDPRSKTVKGLGIAVVVLSVLSVLVSFGVLALGTGVMATADETAAATTQALEESGLSEDITNLLDATQGLDGDTLVALGDYLATLDVDQVHRLGDAVEAKDVKAITKFINKTAGDLPASDKSIVLDALTNLNKSNSKAVGEVLQSMDKQDLQDLPALTVSISSSGLSEIINDAKQDNGEHNGKAVGQELTSELIGIGGGMVVMLGCLGLIASLLSLFAGVFAIRNNAKPDKLTAAFVLSIIAAVCALFTGRLVSLVLLIIMTVYIGKVRALRGQAAAAASSASAGFYGGNGEPPVPPQV